MELLEKLNFTKYQKMIIQSLLKYGTLDAIQISKYSKVPLNKVYEIINNLTIENIIFQINSKPKKYSLLHFEKYLKERIKEKEQELIKLETDYDLFLSKYNEPKFSEEFWILNDLDSLLKKIENSYEHLEFGSSGFIETWVARYSTLKVTKKAIEEGKNVRLIGLVTSENKDIVEKWLKIGTKIKHINMVNKAGFAIFDNNKVKISIQNEKLKSIWSQSESLALILQNYFELLWEKGEEVTLENIDKF